jgi:formyltetrahydrofolate-dependent phosphoribosylglycinamide formyltransferase
MTARLVILISGNGSNLQAILDACSQGEIPAQVVAVFSNKPGVYGLVRAEMAGVPANIFAEDAGEARREYDARLAREISRLYPDYVVLAGWMRLLTSSFLECFPARVINLHPALPGAFPGTHAIQRAYEAWMRAEIDHSGVMVHLVPDEGVDSGPVLAKKRINFRPNETLEQFEIRVHEVEHVLLVQTLKTYLSA